MSLSVSPLECKNSRSWIISRYYRVITVLLVCSLLVWIKNFQTRSSEHGLEARTSGQDRLDGLFYC